jgi:hypothetical protein
MKAMLVSKVALVLALGLLISGSSIALPVQQAPKTAQKTGQETQAKKVQKKKRKTKTAGIPKGVQACIDRLVEIASTDPLPEYGGQAEDIVNNGLLWNDPKSKCSIGSDQALRSKVSSVATAWREKNAEKVRSLLQEIKAAAPQG